MRVMNVLIFLLSIYACYKTLWLFSKERTSIRSTLLWVVLWFTIGIFGLFPDLIDYLMLGSMMRNRMFFLFLVAILILYAMFFGQMTESFESRRKINRLAQELAFIKYKLEYGEDPDPSEQDDEQKESE